MGDNEGTGVVKAEKGGRCEERNHKELTPSPQGWVPDVNHKKDGAY